MGVTFLAIAPEHPLLSHITPSHQKEVQQFIKDMSLINEIERSDPIRPKQGQFNIVLSHFTSHASPQRVDEFLILGLKLDVSAIHPITKKQLPIFIADYVIPDHGTGAIMGMYGIHTVIDFSMSMSKKLEEKQKETKPKALLNFVVVCMIE
jgi:leucyl-tRNA synthetase